MTSNLTLKLFEGQLEGFKWNPLPFIPDCEIASETTHSFGGKDLQSSVINGIVVGRDSRNEFPVKKRFFP